ncbi:MAG: glycosyltransferase family A protein [Spirochaetota bacterium]|nr:glycosyltransferase family A protein [Spirochaetota bacterium]
MNPIVSIIIPTYNRAEMLKRAIDSVLLQTFQDFELIVISDGSTDNTDKIILHYNDDPRIVYIKRDISGGASAARNEGLKIAKGKYIAFLDDDDEWVPDKLELQLPLIENSSKKVGLVYAWMEYFEDKKPVAINAPQLKGNVFPEMLDKQAIGGCPTIIIKKEVVDKVGYFDEELPRGNDGDYWRRITKHYLVDFTPKVLAKVYIGHDRISVNNKKGLKNHIKSAETRLEKFSEDFNKFPEAKAKLLFEIMKANFKLKQFKHFFYSLFRILRVLNINPIRWLNFLSKFLKVNRDGKIFW